MEICVVGVNHHAAPVEVRERFSLPPPLAARLLQTVRTATICHEAVVLDTCNRTEIYYTADNGNRAAQHLLQHIAQLKRTEPVRDLSAFYRHQGLAAVRRLFSVAAALDSQVVGEHEILGQLKDAYRVALEARTARFLMNRLMHRAFRVGKRVRAETRLGEGSVSVAQAAVDLARRFLGDLNGKTVLLIGAGQTGALTAQALVRASPASGRQRPPPCGNSG